MLIRNKSTLALLREKTHVSYDYLEKANGKSRDILMLWEDKNSSVLPTISQAKDLAKSLRVPFAGLYMPPELIPIPELPKLHNMRRTQDAIAYDDSLMNLSIIDLLNARSMLVETNALLGIEIPSTSLPPINSNSVNGWADTIREYFRIDLREQYRSQSARKFYLYIRQKIESHGVLYRRPG